MPLISLGLAERKEASSSAPNSKAAKESRDGEGAENLAHPTKTRPEQVSPDEAVRGLFWTQLYKSRKIFRTFSPLLVCKQFPGRFPATIVGATQSIDKSQNEQKNFKTSLCSVAAIHTDV